MAFTPEAASSLDNDPDALSHEAGVDQWSYAVDEDLWSAYKPYQLAVLEARDGGYGFKAVFTLPLNPESLQRTTPYGIQVTPTLGGIVEQHGGKRFEDITFSGSFGIINGRAGGPALGEGLAGGIMRQAGGIAAGTVQAVQGTVASAQALVPGQSQFEENLYAEDEPGRATGYYQFLACQRFLEAYVDLKKREEGQNLRLALMVWKEQAAYLVTPRTFQVTKDASRPHEYRYTIQLRAWRRLNPHDFSTSGGPLSLPLPAAVVSKSHLRSALNKLTQARNTLAKLGSIPGSIRADFDRTVLGTMRQVTLLLKDTTATVKTFRDFPAQMQKHVAESVRQEWNALSSAAAGLRDVFGSGQQPPPDLEAKLQDPANIAVQDAIPVDNLTTLDPKVQEQMDAEVARCRSLTDQDLASMRDGLMEFAATFTDYIGMGDAAAARREPTDDDVRCMHALYLAADTVASLIPVRQESRTVSPAEYVAGLMGKAGLAARVPASKFAIPFPYGCTLERLAQQYLGDAERWTDIAALNNLRAPYVDEQGTRRPLLVNGSGNEVVVSDASALVIGQFVTLSSMTQQPERRQVISARRLSEGYWLVGLDGPQDLSRFKQAEDAVLHSYLPGTVNSSQVIFIPSDSPAQDQDLRYVPRPEDLERALQVGGVDGMLDEHGDIVVTPDLDWPLTQGFATMVQWARVMMQTPVGSMPLHPNAGIEVQAGESIADMSAKGVLASVKRTFKMNDAFSGVQSAQVVQEGPTVRIDLELGVRGADVLLPVSFRVKQ